MEVELTEKQIASAAGRRYAPAFLRAYILERDNFQCAYCHGTITDATANIDHKRPWPFGLTTPDNLVASCRVCNAAKGARRQRNLSKADKRLIRINAGLSPNAPKGQPWDTGLP